jgi:hypothetical protein
MNEVLDRYLSVDHLDKIVSSKHDQQTILRDNLSLVDLTPLSVYDDLLRSERLPLFAGPYLFYDLAAIKSSEREMIKVISDKDVSIEQLLKNVHEYRNLLRSAWLELCTTEEAIMPTQDLCTIERGIEDMNEIKRRYQANEYGKSK